MAKEQDNTEVIDDEEVDPELLAATEQRMKEVGMLDEDDDDDEVVVESDDDKTVETDDEDDSTLVDDDDDDSTQADDSDDDDSSTSKASKESQDDDDDGIPDAYYRAAIHQGWTADEVNALYEKDKELAVKTCKKLYDSTNKLTSEFANLGRAKLKQEEEATKSKEKPTVDLQLQPLKDEYGEDSAVVKTMEALAQMLAANQQQVVQQQQQQQVPQDDTAAARQLLTNFFTAPDMDPYDEFYGKGSDAKKLTQEQFNNRLQVANVADAILIGAAAMGREMTEEEALEAAHLQVSEPIRETIIRKRIVKKLKKRAKGISLKPSSDSGVTESHGTPTADELEMKTEERLSKIFKR